MRSFKYLFAFAAVAALAFSPALQSLDGVYASIKHAAISAYRFTVDVLAKVFTGPAQLHRKPVECEPEQRLVAAEQFRDAQLQRSRPTVNAGSWRMCPSI